MYGFPVRKHNYEKALHRRKTSTAEKYGGELKAVEAATSHIPPRRGSRDSPAHQPTSLVPSIHVINSSLDDEYYVPISCACACQPNCVCITSVQQSIRTNNNVSPDAYYNYQKNSRKVESGLSFGMEESSSPVPVPVVAPVPASVTAPSLAASKARFEFSKSPRKSSERRSPSPLPTDIHQLFQAMMDDDIDFLIESLDNRIEGDINQTDPRGRTLLSYGVVKNNYVLMEKLLKIPSIDLNICDNEGNTPLHFAVQAGCIESVAYLLNSLAEIDPRNNLGFTPLMTAAIQGRTKIAKLLIFAGASPTMRDIGRGLRAEQWARFCGHYVCADMVEKYARTELLSKATAYGNWGTEQETRPHFVNGTLQPPRSHVSYEQKDTSLGHKVRKFFNISAATNQQPKNHSYSLVSHLTSAALCVSSPLLPNGRGAPVVKSLIKPLTIPRIEITPPDDEVPDSPVEKAEDICAETQHEERPKSMVEKIYSKLRKK